MIHSRKLRKASSFKRILPISTKEQVTPSETDIGAMCTSKVSSHCRSSSLCQEKPFLLKLASQIFVGNQIGSRKVPSCTYTCGYPSRRGFCTEVTLAGSSRAVTRVPRVVGEAQAALLDYLHCTRSLPFTDAEHMSKNSPIFLNGLLQKVEHEQEVGRSVTRFLRYHPINEYEPFFESLGLRPSEFSSFLPRDLMFLSDDSGLLENYHVLCNYGIARGKIGKMYKEATEIFSYDYGVLGSKLRAYEELGLSKTVVIKIVTCSPSLIIGDVNGSFVKLLEEMDALGAQRELVWENLSVKNSYNWSRMLSLLGFFSEMGLGKQDLRMLITKNPSLLFDGSGELAFALIVLQSKMGGSRNDFLSLFSKFPHVHARSFVKNLLQGFQFLIYIEMESEDIRKLVLSHVHVLGTSSLKKATSVLTFLNVGKKRLCKIINEDPNQLRLWVRGMKIDPLPNSGEDQRSFMEKKKFLSTLGFVENSAEMRKALKVFRGKGDELQDRYKVFVKAGLDPKDVSHMIRVAPHILNQTIDVLEGKINFLVKGLGYPLQSLVAFPSYMSYTVERVKLRFLMYNWLKDEGRASCMLALSTILACSDKVFRKQYIRRHPKGPEVWEKFKKALNSS